MSKQINIKFLKVGLLTLVVDASKLGYQKYGVSVGGAMDSSSAETANWLVGNPATTPTLELNITGPEILFEEDCQIAIAGADISPTLSSVGVNMYETVACNKGSILQFGKLNSGCRAYVAIRGNWNMPNWLDANSPKNSSSLKNLNSIQIEKIEPLTAIRKRPKPIVAAKSLVVSVIKGPEFRWLNKEVRNKLWHTTFKILPASNRMGYRIAPNLPSIGKSIISSGVVPGTLQITQEGYPILLMQDSPTTGGYVRALNVIVEDMPKLGQLKVGDNLNFKLVKDH